MRPALPPRARERARHWQPWNAPSAAYRRGRRSGGIARSVVDISSATMREVVSVIPPGVTAPMDRQASGCATARRDASPWNSPCRALSFCEDMLPADEGFSEQVTKRQSLIPAAPPSRLRREASGASCGTLWPAPGTMRWIRWPVNLAALALPSLAARTPSASPSSVIEGTVIGGSVASRRCSSHTADHRPQGQSDGGSCGSRRRRNRGCHRAAAVRSKVASSKSQSGDHCSHNSRAIPRRLAASPARPRSS